MWSDKIKVRPKRFAARRSDDNNFFAVQKTLGAFVGVSECNARTSDKIHLRLEGRRRAEVIGWNANGNGVGSLYFSD